MGYNKTDWLRNAYTTDTKAGKTVITYEYRYKETVSAADDDVKLPALFTGIKIPDEWTNEKLDELGGIKIEIVAQAVQADGFGTADDAWDETFDKP